jgi:hypothetical protein
MAVSDHRQAEQARTICAAEPQKKFVAGRIGSLR